MPGWPNWPKKARSLRTWASLIDNGSPSWLLETVDAALPLQRLELAKVETDPAHDGLGRRLRSLECGSQLLHEGSLLWMPRIRATCMTRAKSRPSSSSI